MPHSLHSLAERPEPCSAKQSPGGDSQLAAEMASSPARDSTNSRQEHSLAAGSSSVGHATATNSSGASGQTIRRQPEYRRENKAFVTFSGSGGAALRRLHELASPVYCLFIFCSVLRIRTDLDRILT